MRNEKLKFILYAAHTLACMKDGVMAGGKGNERWRKMIEQFEKISFQRRTQLCLGNVLRRQLYKLLCGKDYQKNSGKLVEFLIHHVKITMRYSRVDSKWIKLLDDSAELIMNG